MPVSAARLVVSSLLLAAVVVALSSPAAAQGQSERVPAPDVVTAGQPGQPPPGIDQRRAEDLRSDLRQLMQQYPPALGRVLRLDASLMTNASYLAAYPALAAFLQLHPEVARYPDYFLNWVGSGGWNGWEEPLDSQAQLRREALNAQRNIFENLTIIGAVSIFVFGITWLVRLFVGHRRWIRATRLQAELNNRLLERMGTNEQLLAYLQSQPGQALTATPVINDVTTPATAMPFNRILWAVQAGVVLAAAGVGMLVIRRSVFEEAGDVFLTLGVIAISLGAGFVLASVASYLLSRRFGLIGDSPTGSTDAGRP